MIKTKQKIKIRARRFNYRFALGCICLGAPLIALGSPELPEIHEALAQSRLERAWSMLESVDPVTLASQEAQQEFLLLEMEAASRLHRPLLKEENAESDVWEQSDPIALSKYKYWQGVQAIIRGEFRQALNIYTLLQDEQDHPYYESVIHNLARLQLELGNTEGALESIFLLDEDSPPTILIKADCLLRMGELEDAEEVLATIPAERKSARHALLLAMVTSQKGDFKGAIQILKGEDLLPDTVQGRLALSYLASLLLEQEDESALKIIKQVLQKAGEYDPLSQYYDQYFLAAQTFGEESEDSITYLSELENSVETQSTPYVLYHKAQLTKNLEQKLELLAEVYRQSPDHPVAVKACHVSMQLAGQLDSIEQSQQWLNKIARDCPDAPLKAKIYSFLAESSEGAKKKELYEQALYHAANEQISLLRLNYNLAQFELGKGGRALILSSDQRSNLLIEKALRSRESNPKNAQKWLEQFFELEKSHPKQGEAHLAIAEIYLKSAEQEDRLLAKGHLQEIEALHLETLNSPERFFRAQVILAVIEKDEQRISQLVRGVESNLGALLETGQAVYQAGYYYQASLLFKKVLKDGGEGVHLELADFYIALCHLNLNTSEYQRDALERLHKLSEKATVSIMGAAREVLADHYISTGQGAKGLGILDSLSETPATLLLKARGHTLSKESADLKKAISAYQKLFKNQDYPTLFRYQVVSQLSALLERTDQQPEALELYYQVANFEVIPQPESEEGWGIYKNLMDMGVSLLEGAGKWRSAYTFCQSLASQEFPYSKSFQLKADDLALKHILWDENKF